MIHADLTINPATLKAYEAAELGFIPDWTRSYLNAVSNPELAEGISSHSQGWSGPLEVSLAGVHRIVKPGDPSTNPRSKKLFYVELPETWEEKVNHQKERIEAGWLPGPLIVVDFLEGREGSLAIGFGNHEHAALESLG